MPGPGRDPLKRKARSWPLLTYSALGGLRQDPQGGGESSASAEIDGIDGIGEISQIDGNGKSQVRVVLSTYGSRGDVEPLVGLAGRLKSLGAEVKVCAPPDEDFARRLATVGVEMVGVGRSARELTTAKAAPTPGNLPQRAAELIADQFAVLPAAAEGADVLLATGVMPAAAGARSVAEKLGVRSVSVTFQQLTLPSPHHSPLPYPGRPFPPGVTDNRALWDLDAQSIDALFGEALNTNRAAIGLPPVARVRDYVIGDRPWLASDPVLDPWQPTDGGLDVVQTGAWIVPDERPLPPQLTAFLEAGAPPVYVGFGSMPLRAQEGGPEEAARVAVEAVRAQGRRVILGSGWAGLALTEDLRDHDDCFVVGEVNQQALFRRVAAVVHHGGAGTTTTAARAAAPQVVVPQATDQPYWARRVADLGIGAAHDGPTPTVDSLSAALKAALAPGTAARATAVAGTIRTDGTTVAAKLLLGSESWRSRELRAENRYVTHLYGRLETQRDFATDRLRELHLQERGGTAQSRMERDTLESHHTRRLWELRAAENGLCFGRIENAEGERQYIGRIALADEDHEPVLTDWRAAAAEPFYRATPATPGAVVARRHLRSKGRTVVDFDDDAFGVSARETAAREQNGQHGQSGQGGHSGRDTAELSGESALLASLTAARTGRMADIVATIQAEQDRVIRSELGGVLVVQGGPGTGKTVVALHRAAYLLYTHRDRLAKRGVLVIGPNLTFLRYIDQVLPALGESEVVLSSIGALYPGVTGADTESPEAAAVKGDARMAGALVAALEGLRGLPETEWTIVVGKRSPDEKDLRIDRALCERAHRAAHKTNEPHNQARPDLIERLSSELALRIARDQERDGGAKMGMDAVATLADTLVAEPEFTALVDRLWPLLSPEQVLTALYGDPELRVRAMPDFSDAERAALQREVPDDQADWTTADVPLLDEAAELLGPLPGRTPARRATTAEEADELEHARAVVENFGEGLYEIDAEMLMRQYRGEESLRPLSERAIEDRTWGFGHIIVDEAQELSPMAWRLLTRRCPGRSMTIVGDLAQTGAPAGLSSWSEALDTYTAGRWRTVELTVNYRTPSEIMRVSEGVLRAVDPGRTAPSAVRSGGVPPWSLRIPGDDRGAALRAAVEKEIAALVRDGGRMAIIHAPGWPAELSDALAELKGVTVADGQSALDSPAVLMTAAQSKGLEFDAVLVVEPTAILAAHTRGVNDLYVAITRATKTLGVIHSEELPAMLEGLVPR